MADMVKMFRNVLLFSLLSGVALASANTYTAEIESARTARVQHLTKPDGWLSLIGLHFLKPGENTIGSAADNAIVIPKLPAHFHTLTLAADGKVRLGTQELKVESENTRPTVVSSGSVSFFVVERGGKYALRVKDSDSDRRTHFLGLDYFPVDPKWRIEAKWIPFEKPQEVPILNIIGNVSNEKIPGKAVFDHDGKTIELIPIIEGPSEPLFFVISDATSGKTTYSAARFLYAWRPGPDGKIILDFNLAYNPPCAFTPFATCPLPPPQNRMTFAITAGEKKYRGRHE